MEIMRHGTLDLSAVLSDLSLQCDRCWFAAAHLHANARSSPNLEVKSSDLTAEKPTSVSR